jgi:hypothetical protein
LVEVRSNAQHPALVEPGAAVALPTTEGFPERNLRLQILDFRLRAAFAVVAVENRAGFQSSIINLQSEIR